MQQIDQQRETDAIMHVIAAESEAFWNKDYDAWASYWVQAPYIRRFGWWARGGVTVVEGWDTLSIRMKETMREYPEPNPTAAQVRRVNVNLRVVGEMAWLTFDQYAPDTGEARMDMPGLSRETRVLEKHHGEWKLAYVNYLLEETNENKKT